MSVQCFRGGSCGVHYCPCVRGTRGGEGEGLLLLILCLSMPTEFSLLDACIGFIKKVKLKNALRAGNLSIHYKKDTGDPLGLGLFADVSDVW